MKHIKLVYILSLEFEVISSNLIFNILITLSFVFHILHHLSYQSIILIGITLLFDRKVL